MSHKSPGIVALEQTNWLEELERWLASGNGYNAYAAAKNVSVAALYALMDRTPDARARAFNAWQAGAEAIVERAEEVLRNADASSVEVTRAAHLSKLYQWKASKMSKQYADKQEVSVSGTLNLSGLIKQLDTHGELIEGEVIDDDQALLR